MHVVRHLAALHGIGLARMLVMTFPKSMETRRPNSGSTVADRNAPASRRPGDGYRWAALVALGAAFAVAIRQHRPRPTFEGRTVLITGGSRGLGFALARAFAAEKATLVLLARSEDQLHSAASRLEGEFGARPLTITCDVRDAAAVSSAVATIATRTGRIDVLVNNAGVIQVGPLAHAQPEDFDDSLRTHFWGPYFMIRACLPHLVRTGGQVVNIGSIGGVVAVPHLLPYCVGKFALTGFSQGLRAELAREGVSVTTVAPHLMRTGSHRNVIVRGRHAREAVWFALGTATRATALHADHAARRIVDAARARQAWLVLGWPAKVAAVLNVAAPVLVAASAALVNRALPSATDATLGDAARRSSAVWLGPVARLFATEAARALNQRVAPDEA